MTERCLSATGQDPLPIWLGVGGTPSARPRAGVLGLPLMVAIIGGQPERFVPFADLFRRTARAAGHVPAPDLSHQQPRLRGATARSGPPPRRSRHSSRDDEPRSPASAASRPWTGEAFEASRRPARRELRRQPVQQVAEKILWEHELFGHQRFLLQMIGGGMPHAQRDALHRAVRDRGRPGRPAGAGDRRRCPRPRPPRRRAPRPPRAGDRGGPRPGPALRIDLRDVLRTGRAGGDQPRPSRSSGRRSARRCPGARVRIEVIGSPASVDAVIGRRQPREDGLLAGRRRRVDTPIGRRAESPVSSW